MYILPPVYPVYPPSPLCILACLLLHLYPKCAPSVSLVFPPPPVSQVSSSQKYVWSPPHYSFHIVSLTVFHASLMFSCLMPWCSPLPSPIKMFDHGFLGTFSELDSSSSVVRQTSVVLRQMGIVLGCPSAVLIQSSVVIG